MSSMKVPPSSMQSIADIEGPRRERHGQTSLKMTNPHRRNSLSPSSKPNVQPELPHQDLSQLLKATKANGRASKYANDSSYSSLEAGNDSRRYVVFEDRLFP